ncbi:CHRD domain-containing protein [Synoicihabitans lomoniglobus]|uniref:CHRD domain-containing protein n=1 Tax=Synoicihabitans lomoniglobus TaxID=2909285 RepID=A0AAF0I2C4_9BACT|nr:CHRD domain-containing protein [Opitutaceae bacterium LMO-M01]WED66417.1 CHRD domain-containing protein [Opitutaceae bacterium LMO-M01]
MTTTLLKRTVIAFFLTAIITLPATAARIRLSANLDAAQETPASASTATGMAEMWYDTATNTFNLTVNVTGMANLVTGSHLHEAPAGSSGGVVTGLGAETVYTRNGDDLSASFSGLSYGGDPATLLAGGAYVNIHSAIFPGGEIRGQLWADPVQLWAKLSPEQETATVESDAYGAAQMTLYPVTGKFELIVFAYNFTNTFAASHIHEGAVGTNGGVVNGLGGAADYNQNGNTYSQVWNDVDYAGDMMTLLNGGAYINIHSDVHAGGEIRGQLWASEAGRTASHLSNVSSRGAVGAGDASLVVGFVIEGTEPLTVIVTGRGPVLTEFGVVGALADPVLYVHDRWGNQIFWNDNAADTTYLQPITESGFAPTVAAEAAAILLLPPGPHTMTVKGAGDTTGIALAEAFQQNNN